MVVSTVFVLLANTAHSGSFYPYHVATFKWMSFGAMSILGFTAKAAVIKHGNTLEMFWINTTRILANMVDS